MKSSIPEHPPVRFTVLGETEDFLAVDKPALLLVHPSKPGGPRTLLDGLKELLCYEKTTGGTISIINRLDRETSGVILIAKTGNAARELSMAMERRQIEKEYLALCRGWPSETKFTVDAPILRLGEVEPSRVWLRRGVHPDGQLARTEFRVEKNLHLSSKGDISLVRAFPATGRTHQIRVHLAWAGFPVLGDKLYFRGEDPYLEFIEKGWTQELEEKLWLSRHALHSSQITFSYQGRKYSYQSPLPEDFQTILNSSNA